MFAHDFHKQNVSQLEIEPCDLKTTSLAITETPSEDTWMEEWMDGRMGGWQTSTTPLQ